ncbi:MAG: DUF2058 domain-containing protein [Pseudomonadales bacterium]
MAGSLRDQLIKAGLATPDRARKVDREVRVEKQARRKGKSSAPQPSAAVEARARAQEINHQKAERDRAQMRAIADKAKAKALQAEIKQIVVQNDRRVKTQSDDDVAYNFVHGKRVKRIYVPKAQRDQISNGSLVIVNNDGIYHLLPKAAAEKVRARDPKRIIVAHSESKPAPGSDDDYYARFEVPDDLDW